MQTCSITEIIVVIKSGRLVFSIPDKANTCKKENSTQYSEDDNALYIARTFPTIHEINRRKYQPCCAQQGKDYTKNTFFHNKLFC